MKPTKKCPQCDSYFTQKTPNQKQCSKLCTRIASSLRRSKKKIEMTIEKKDFVFQPALNKFLEKYNHG